MPEHLNKLMGVQANGEATAYTPSWRERTAGLLQDGLEKLMGTDQRYRARKIAETLLGGPSSNLPMRMGLLDPTVVGSVFGRQEAPNLGPGAPPGLLNTAAIVFHGSPHKFPPMKLLEMPDGARVYQNMLERPGIVPGAKVLKDFPLGIFDAKHIGKGEGAQAYGHGLYLAESPGVARSYQAMDKNKLYIGDKALVDIIGQTPNVYVPGSGAPDIGSIYRAFHQSRPSINQPHSVQSARAFWEKYNDPDRPDYAVTKALWDKIDASAVVPVAKEGYLYKVDLPDSAIARMLDWDKPLSQQPSVMDAMRRAGYKPDPDMTAGAFIQSKQGEGFAQYLADDLRKQGIPGIRYLDGDSRAKGVGTSNYVVFPGEETLLSILERNGMPIK